MIGVGGRLTSYGNQLQPSLFLLFVAGEEFAVLLLHKTDFQHKTTVILVDRFPE